MVEINFSIVFYKKVPHCFYSWKFVLSNSCTWCCFFGWLTPLTLPQSIHFAVHINLFAISIFCEHVATFVCIDARWKKVQISCWEPGEPTEKYRRRLAAKFLTWSKISKFPTDFKSAWAYFEKLELGRTKICSRLYGLHETSTDHLVFRFVSWLSLFVHNFGYTFRSVPILWWAWWWN